MYNGYLSGCTAFLDLDADGQKDYAEPSAVTTPFGKFELTIPQNVYSQAGYANKKVIVQPGYGCTDTSTGLLLDVEIQVLAACGAQATGSGMVNMITAVQTEVDVGTPAGVISNGLDLTTFDACTYDPLGYAWTASMSRAEQTTFANFIQANLAVTTLVKTLSDVTGYQSNQAYADASQAIVAGIADAFEQFMGPGVITFNVTETEDLARTGAAAATAASSSTLLGNTVLSKIANTTASLLVVVAAEATEYLAQVQTDPSRGLVNLAKTSVLAQNATTAAADLLLSGATADQVEQALVDNTASTVITDIGSLVVPAAKQAPGPSPPPPPSPPTLSPPPSPVGSPGGGDSPPPSPALPGGTVGATIETFGADVSADEEDPALYTLFLLFLLPPLFFCVYVQMAYPNVQGKYLKWRFSHSVAYINCCGYMPEERRDNLWKEIQDGKQSGGKPNPTSATSSTISSTASSTTSKPDVPTKDGATGASAAPDPANSSSTDEAPAPFDPATGKV